ncbi:MFS transporter [Streptomyces sp. NBC_01020]|uniref:MFS transporter n=1 Tax=unclassified Streptomyces TaxID=2593676 RepID=UPI0038678D35|nr:MFS transporter [Streptomyces sp. NBC_01020]WSX42713.1 MFS transporter [Streptomyces sp. NBC_00963]
MPTPSDRVASPAGKPGGTPRFAAPVVAFAFWITMVGTTVPTPLYPLYENDFSFSPIMVTVIFAVYAIGVVVGLLTFGRLSDQIGRRPVLMAATVLSVCAAVVFLIAGDVPVLLFGRVLSGFSAALVTGAGTAALTELMPPDGRVRPATVALFANMGGLACGPLLAGVLADTAPSPLRTPWVVSLVLAALALAGLALTPETARHRTGFTFRLQPLHVPAEIRSDFLRSAMVTGTGFAVLGVLTAVTGLFLGDVLHDTDHTLTGAVVFTAFVCTALGQLLIRRIGSGPALTVACVGLIAAAALIATAMVTETLAPLIVGAAVNGLATGIAIGYGLGTITTRSDPEHRGAAVSTFFAILYTMLAVPSIGVGVLIHVSSLRPAGEVFSCAVALLALAVLVSLAAGRRTGEGGGT